MTAKKLLVADDSATIQKVIRLALANETYEIHAVADGSEAIQQIALFKPDIVLIDVSLSNQNAFEVKRAINQREELNSIRFILMSSAFEKVDEAQALQVGFDARLTKPFDPAHLREILLQVVSPQTIDMPDFPLNDLPTSFSSTGDSDRLSNESDLILDNLNTQSLSADDDIRRLTESTIRISGLDHFEATTNEATDLNRDELEWSVQEPVSKPRSSTVPPPPRFQVPPPPSSMTPPPPPKPTSSPSLSEAEIEKVVEEKVEEVLRKVTQNILPGVLEKIVKEEIHRLLSEQP